MVYIVFWQQFARPDFREEIGRNLIGLYEMHCHLIPAVDDGAQTMEEALALLQMEYADGVRHVLLTPHYRRKMFETPRDAIRERYEQLKQEAKVKWPDLELLLGCEFHAWSDMVQEIRSDEAYRLNGGKTVLLEFSGADEPSYILDRIRTLMMSGFEVIIAHAERYEAVFDDLDFVEEIRKNGAAIQINADSILGHDGRVMKRFCKKLLKNDLIDYIGSDAHGRGRDPRIGECAAYLTKKYGQDTAERLLIRNPEGLLKGTT